MHTRCSTVSSIWRLLTGVGIAVFLALPVWAQEIVLMPNETLCSQEYTTNGVVVEASHFVSSQKYFSCDMKFKPKMEVNATYQWVLRIERVFIPYSTASLAPTIYIHTPDEIRSIEYTRDTTNYSGVVLLTRRLILQFVNIPRDADYKFVITLDSGESNCTSGYRCSQTGYCIEPGLMCDNEDHCGDSSDESDDHCPGAADVVSIAIMAGGSAVVALLIGLAAFLVVRCSRKAATYNDSRRRDELALMGKRVTYIRQPGRSRVSSLSSLGGGASLPRRSGLGYQPAPFVFKKTFAEQPTTVADQPASLSVCVQVDGSALTAFAV